MRTARRTILSFTAASALALIVPAAAFANDYCVGTPSGVTCTTTRAFSEGGLALALADAQANAGADRVMIDDGTIAISSTLTYSPTETVEIIGSGVGQTIIQRTDSSGTMFDADLADSSSTVTDITFRQTGVTTGNFSVFEIRRGVARNILVEDQSTNDDGSHTLKLTTGATLENSTVSSNSPNDNGIAAGSGNATVRGSTIVAANGDSSYGISASASTYSVERSTFRGWSVAILADSGTMSVSDSILDLGARTNAMGVAGYNPGAGTLTINLNVDRITVVGSGTNQTGIIGGADLTSETFVGNITNTLMRVTGTGGNDFVCIQSNGRPATLNTDHSAFDPTRITRQGTCGGTDSSQLDTSANPPLFVNAGGGDYSPAVSSPVIDAGTDLSSLPGGSLDFSGDPRAVSSGCSGLPLADIGAEEYQLVGPKATAGADKTTVSPGETVNFSASTPGAAGSVTLGWSTDDGATGTGSSFAHAFTTPGAHSATVTATNVDGRQCAATVLVSVTGPSVADPASLVVKTKPTKAFKRGNKGFRLKPNSSQPFIGLDVAAAGKTKLTLARKTTGVRKSGKCVRGSGRPRCTRYAKLKGSQSLTFLNGSTRLIFGGRWNRKQLPAGTYRLTLTPSGGPTAGVPVVVTLKLK